MIFLWSLSKRVEEPRIVRIGVGWEPPGLEPPEGRRNRKKLSPSPPLFLKIRVGRGQLPTRNIMESTKRGLQNFSFLLFFILIEISLATLIYITIVIFRYLYLFTYGNHSHVNWTAFTCYMFEFMLETSPQIFHTATNWLTLGMYIV